MSYWVRFLVGWTAGMGLAVCLSLLFHITGSPGVLLGFLLGLVVPMIAVRFRLPE
jgi:hypothetical protein